MTESREEKLKRQSDENFALIGRYVQAFEHMVDAARMGSSLLLGGGQLADIVLNHQAMTAKPLFDVFSALVTEVLKPDPKLDKEAREALEHESKIAVNLLGKIAGDYQEAMKFRNDLLHSTWFIGWASPDQEDFSEMYAHKLKTTASGLRVQTDIAKKEKILEEISKCENIINRVREVWIGALQRLTKGDTSFYQRNFTLDRKKWKRAVRS